MAANILDKADTCGSGCGWLVLLCPLTDMSQWNALLQRIPREYLPDFMCIFSGLFRV